MFKSLNRQWAVDGAESLGDPSSFRLMTWNVWQQQSEVLDWSQRDFSWAGRRGAIISEILAHKPHIIALQEVNAEAFYDLAASLGEHGYAAVCGSDAIETEHGLSVATFYLRDRWEPFSPIETVGDELQMHDEAEILSTSTVDGDGSIDREAVSAHNSSYSYSFASDVASCNGILRFTMRQLLSDNTIRSRLEGCPVPPDASQWDDGGCDALAALSHDWFWSRTACYLPRPSLLTLLRSKTHPVHVVAVINAHFWGGTGFRFNTHPLYGPCEHPTLAMHAAMTSHALRIAMEVSGGFSSRSSSSDNCVVSTAAPSSSSVGYLPAATGVESTNSEVSVSGDRVPSPATSRVSGILAGDFNCDQRSRRRVPGERGGVYQLLTSGVLPQGHPEHPAAYVEERTDHGLPVCLHPASVPPIRCPLLFASAYASPVLYGGGRKRRRDEDSGEREAGGGLVVNNKAQLNGDGDAPWTALEAHPGSILGRNDDDDAGDDAIAPSSSSSAALSASTDTGSSGDGPPPSSPGDDALLSAEADAGTVPSPKDMRIDFIFLASRFVSSDGENAADGSCRDMEGNHSGGDDTQRICTFDTNSRVDSHGHRYKLPHRDHEIDRSVVERIQAAARRIIPMRKAQVNAYLQALQHAHCNQQPKQQQLIEQQLQGNTESGAREAAPAVVTATDTRTRASQLSSSVSAAASLATAPTAASAAAPSDSPVATHSPPWFAPLMVLGGLLVPAQREVLAAVNDELRSAGKLPWHCAIPPAPNAAMPSDHIPLVADLTWQQ